MNQIKNTLRLNLEQIFQDHDHLKKDMECLLDLLPITKKEKKKYQTTCKGIIKLKESYMFEVDDEI